jgi:positive regulator of sigma E activity
MENPTGRILSLVDGADGARALVKVAAAAACPRCAAGKGCGAGIFAVGDSEREIEASVPVGLTVAVDDVVEISLAPDNVLQAAILVYGLPLSGAILAAAVAYAFSLGDVGAAMAALLGLGGGLAAGRWRLRQPDCLHGFVPSVERRL